LDWCFPWQSERFGVNIIQQVRLMLRAKAAFDKMNRAYNSGNKIAMRLSLIQLLRSRTFWTAVGGAAFNAYNVEAKNLDPHFVEMANAAIVILTAIFRAFPKQGG
jgi:hypothetical protein